MRNVFKHKGMQPAGPDRPENLGAWVACDGTVGDQRTLIIRLGTHPQSLLLSFHE